MTNLSNTKSNYEQASRSPQSRDIAKVVDIRQTSTSFPQRYLYGFATKGEVVTYLRTQASDDDFDRLDRYLRDWDEAQRTVQANQINQVGLAETIANRPIPAEERQLVDSYIKDPTVRSAFATLPITVELVEIDKLVAAQRVLDLTYVQELKERYGRDPTPADAVLHCLNPEQPCPPVHHLEVQPGVHVFSSPSSDLRMLGSFVKRQLTKDDRALATNGGVPIAAVVTYVGFGSSPVNAFQFGQRVVLNNGYHRLYALRELGFSHAPMIIQRVCNPLLEFPPVVGNLPREYLLGSPRPPLFGDFFSEEVATTFGSRSRLQMVTIAPQVQAHPIPA